MAKFPNFILVQFIFSLLLVFLYHVFYIVSVLYHRNICLTHHADIFLYCVLKALLFWKLHFLFIFHLTLYVMCGRSKVLFSSYGYETYSWEDCTFSLLIIASFVIYQVHTCAETRKWVLYLILLVYLSSFVPVS